MLHRLRVVLVWYSFFDSEDELQGASDILDDGRDVAEHRHRGFGVPDGLDEDGAGSHGATDLDV